ncbi:MAG: tRNA (adenosine(37)-N6)-threonylcarbamoyltransferase complex ATPase subunit type 1 TsaE [Planctomycetota bacterium]
MTHHTVSPTETQNVAAELAATLCTGDVIALRGDLGAGKTTFTRGLVTALGGDPAAVTSPTYTLLQVYPTPRGDVFHVDAYRAVPDDLEDLIAGAFCTVIEWPDRTDLDANIRVIIDHTDNGRTLHIESPRL